MQSKAWLRLKLLALMAIRHYSSRSIGMWLEPRQVNIWNDPWLPGPGDGRIRSQNSDMSYTVVSDLIDADSCAWKFDVLDRLFDAESNLVSRFYKQLWAVNLPPKLKITMWRVANKFIPTFASLRSKRLNVNDVCPLCQSSSETLEHLLRDCYFVLELHNALDVSISQSADTDDWFTWLAVLFCSLNESVKMRLIVSYWAVWFTRNKVVHENVVPSVSECVAFCRSFLADCGSFPTDARANTAHQPVAWEAPPVNVFKFNFDAAYDSQGKRTMVGVIGRDNAGNIVASCVAPFSNVADVLVAESLACLQAVRYAKDLGFRRVIFEGDSLTVVKKINEGRLERSVTAPLIYDIRVAAKDFDSVSFTFARSDANRAAHTLARDYRSQQSPYFWIEEAPAGATVAANLDRSKLVSA
ncbi:hypothetical protein V6N11_031951 [Hibiscus sabdariffa]|uniref:Uncharacterized protein n=1 Tax=Hibiscus sabdariffa TaxID=183260 RepID=A0ABR2SZ57_9ROSI